MPVEKSPKQASLLDRRAKVSELHKQGYSQYKIADELQVHQSTISRDLALIYEEWLISPLINFNEAKMRELGVIDQVETEAWKAWETSLENRESRTVSGTNDKPSSVSVRKDEQNGNPAYLKIILECSRKRADLLGLIVQRVEPDDGQVGGSLDSYGPLFATVGEIEKIQRVK